MKIEFNESRCKKNKLTADEFLTAVCIKYVDDLDSILSSLQKKGVICHEDGQYVIVQDWNDKIDDILAHANTSEDERIAELAAQMRNMFPEGRMPGTGFYYRCNQHEIERKLKKFFSVYGKYDSEDVINATQRYLDSFCGNYTYLSLLKYFISKLKPVTDEDGTVHNVETSLLATYLENKDCENNRSSDDWMLKIRN